MIEGLLLTPLKVIEHPLGAVMHGLRSDAPGYAGFGEAYFSVVNHGALKGWKRHTRMVSNLVVPVGAVRLVVHDDRPGSATRGGFEDLVLSASPYARLTLPAGLWFAFQGRGEGLNLMLNLASILHDPAEAETRAPGTPGAPDYVF